MDGRFRRFGGRRRSRFGRLCCGLRCRRFGWGGFHCFLFARHWQGPRGVSRHRNRSAIRSPLLLRSRCALSSLQQHLCQSFHGNRCIDYTPGPAPTATFLPVFDVRQSAPITRRLEQIECVDARTVADTSRDGDFPFRSRLSTSNSVHGGQSMNMRQERSSTRTSSKYVRNKVHRWHRTCMF